MPQPSSTNLPNQQPPRDSGVDMSPKLSVNASRLAHSVSHHRQAQSSQISLQHIQSDHAAAVHTQAERANTVALPNGVYLPTEIALPPSQPTSSLSLNPNGQVASSPPGSPVPREPQTPCPQQHGGNANEAVNMMEIDRVLGPLKGRKTPVLTNAPKLQWDLTKPLFPMPSISTLDGEAVDEGEGESEPEPHDNKTAAKKMVVRAGTPMPILPSGIDATSQQQHRKPNSKSLSSPLLPYPHTNITPAVPSFSSLSSSPPPLPSSPLSQPPTTPPRSPSPTLNIPSLLRVLDANIQPQPHRLSPLMERDDETSELLTRQSSSTANLVFFSSRASPSPSPSPNDELAAGRRYQAYVEDERQDESTVQQQQQGQRVSSRATRETDPRLFEAPIPLGVRTARCLPVQRVGRGEVLGPRLGYGTEEEYNDEGDGSTTVDVGEGQHVQVQCRNGNVDLDAVDLLLEGGEGKAGKKRRWVRRIWGRIRRVVCGRGTGSLS